MSTLTPSRFGPLDEDTAFQLPVSGLFADMETGSASVRMCDDFLALGPRERFLAAQSWVRELRGLADAAMVDMFRDFAGAREASSIVDHVAAFREEARREGLTVPSDLAVLLQRY